MKQSVSRGLTSHYPLFFVSTPIHHLAQCRPGDVLRTPRLHVHVQLTRDPPRVYYGAVALAKLVIPTQWRRTALPGIRRRGWCGAAADARDEVRGRGAPRAAPPADARVRLGLTRGLARGGGCAHARGGPHGTRTGSREWSVKLNLFISHFSVLPASVEAAATCGVKAWGAGGSFRGRSCARPVRVFAFPRFWSNLSRYWAASRQVSCFLSSFRRPRLADDPWLLLSAGKTASGPPKYPNDFFNIIESECIRKYAQINPENCS
ncbi:hypothetical protein EDB89DRAFT_683851 [Lactarius sanguifluus]|nr:hypothetical protein EDB89DRAFT_683851 [Lactarius sanguifluus]